MSFLCYFDVLRHCPENFLFFPPRIVGVWRRVGFGFWGRVLYFSALVLFCVGEEGGGVFFGGGDFAAEHAGEFVDALFGF